MTKKAKSRIGSSFDDFLKEDATYDEVAGRAITRVVARLSALEKELDSGFRPVASPGMTEKTTSPPRATRRR